MAKNNRCGCCGRRNSNSSYGCLNNVGGRRRWDNYPYYDGVCPDVEGDYDEDRRCRRCRRCRDDGEFGIFTAMLPVAVPANGIIPLVNGGCTHGNGDFPVNSGLITIEEEGVYLATFTIRIPHCQRVNTTVTLNVNDASQASAVTEVGGEGPASFTAQAIFEVNDRATVALRSSEAINITETSAQPLATLTLIRLRRCRDDKRD